MEIVNVNSQIAFPEEALKMCHSRDDFSQIIVGKCPVFLVDAHLMDLIYPPWKKRKYNESCIAGMLESVLSEIDNTLDKTHRDEEKMANDLEAKMDSFWGNIEECRCDIGESILYLPACGVFVQSASRQTLGVMKTRNSKKMEKYIDMDIIVLCPERIATWSKASAFPDMSLSSCFSTLISSVWLHEAAHAWLRTDPSIYQTDWGFIVEESIVQAYSINMSLNTLKDDIFSKESDVFLRHAVSKQRFPYSAWAFWSNSESYYLPVWREKYKCDIRFRRRSYRPRYIIHEGVDGIFHRIGEAFEYSARYNNRRLQWIMWKLLALQLLHWAIPR